MNLRETILVLGPTNGWTCWKDLDLNDFHKVIFLGGLTEWDGGFANDVTFNEVHDNLRKIVIAAINNRDKIVLIPSAIDMLFLETGVPEKLPVEYRDHFSTCYQMHGTMKYAFNRNVLTPCYMYRDFIFSNGGISTLWLGKNLMTMYGLGLGDSDISFNDFVKNTWTNSLKDSFMHKTIEHNKDGIEVRLVNSPSIESPIFFDGYFQKAKLLNTYNQVINAGQSFMLPNTKAYVLPKHPSLKEAKKLYVVPAIGPAESLEETPKKLIMKVETQYNKPKAL